jgi:hypothetical protein
MNEQELQKILYDIFLNSNNTNLFDQFITICQKWYEAPAHSLGEIKRRDNKKIRGDIFELFSLLYLKYIKNYENPMLLKDVPKEMLEKLSIKKRDMGIDIIVQHKDNYYAVQCKYKKHISKKKNIVTWKALSTFYALCLRSGPWEKYIVMTNCDYAKHEGKKSEKDMSLCIGTFRNIDKDNWLKMCNLHGNSLLSFNIIQESTPIIINDSNLMVKNTSENLSDKKSENLSDKKSEKDLLREKRLKYYQ